MTLKYKVRSKNEIPPEHLGLYAEKEGAWMLRVDGAVDASLLEEAQHSRAEEVERAVASRVQNMAATWEKQLGAVTAERDTLNTRLASIQIDQAVVTEATKRGLRATALPDITARARQAFRLVNGVPQACEAGGQGVRPGKDGVTPLSLAEWIDLQVTEAPHLFESNVGGGGGGASSPYGNGSAGVRKNPFRKGADWNLTEQMRLLKTDPPLAQRLKAEA